jgi:tRNA1Val (adenine37-N6)-methyltransferase
MKVCTDSCILGAYANYSHPNKILDIGTGTGLLSLMLGQKYTCKIDAVEIDDLRIASGLKESIFIKKASSFFNKRLLKNTI